MHVQNTYADPRRAAAYDELELGRTYDLVFRNLPRLLAAHARGRSALDFGCGTGRSTRFLKSLGYAVTGVDISAEMVALARRRDPDGEYHLTADGDFAPVSANSFDLVLSAFTFDNISDHAHRAGLFRSLRDLLSARGVLVNVVSTPEIYVHEWATFSTRAFPENRDAKPGDVVRIVTTDYSDARPVDDVLWPDASYQALYRDSGLVQVVVEQPLAAGEGPWKCETSVAPWAIYVLRTDDARQSSLRQFSQSR